LRRARRSLLLAIAFLTAVLTPGAAVFARSGAGTCLTFDLRELTLAVEQSKLIVVARVQAVSPGREATLAPEAYLKGPAKSDPVRLRYPDPAPRCPLAGFSSGSRVLVFLTGGSDGIEWPGTQQAYLLQDGRAFIADPIAERLTTEEDLVRQVRAITGQYAVPAATAGEGASIHWVGTVLPVTLALLVVFGIALLLMRTWHRIDPS
jgi:hypothetical protein